MVKQLLLEMLKVCFDNEYASVSQSYPQDELLLNAAYHHDVGLLIGDMMKLERRQRLVNRILKQKNLKRYEENLIHFDPVAYQLELLGIDYVITKGIYAAKTAYVDESYRRSDDLDVIIRREDYLKVKQILNNHGYLQGIYNSVTDEIEQLSRRQELFFLTYTNQSAPFLKKTGDDFLPIINLDVNFYIFWENREVWNSSELLSNYQIFPYNGHRVKTFQDEYMLMHMCLHAYYDMNSIYQLNKTFSYRLKYFSDIFGFIKRAKISWDKFRAVCTEYDVGKYIMYIFYYTSLVFDDKHLLTISRLEVPDNDFLNRFGLNNEGCFVWQDSFMNRLFCDNKESLLDKYCDDKMKAKMHQKRFFEEL